MCRTSATSAALVPSATIRSLSGSSARAAGEPKYQRAEVSASMRSVSADLHVAE